MKPQMNADLSRRSLAKADERRLLTWSAAGGELVFRFLFINAVLAGMLLTGATVNGATEVRIVKAPADCIAPDVAMDTNGVLHMVYGLNDTAYYIRSTNNGRSFTSPVKVNSSGTVGITMGERGPKVSIGLSNSIHVVWMDKWSSGVQVYARYSRSLDNGATFEDRRILSSTSGVDGVTVAADTLGNVASFWHVNQPPTGQPSATRLRMVMSSDNGATFGADQLMSITNMTGLACSMCMMRPFVRADGNMYLAFRTADDNIRDIYVLKGPIGQNNFTALRVNTDNWNINYCPMNGPELTFDPSGRALCGFMTSDDKKSYWAISDNPVTSFSLHVATPANEPNELYSTAIANSRGDVLFVWQIGMMAVTGTSTVKWARYTSGGVFTGEQGTIGDSFAGTKATAFVGTDDNFYIVTTANMDANANGMPDGWEIHYFLGTNAQNGGPTDDWDSDGCGNLDEYIAGTDPTNKNSRFQLVIGPTNGLVEVQFPAVGTGMYYYSGVTRSYKMEHSTDLLFANGWSGIQNYTNIPGADQTVAYTSSAPDNVCFYRAKVSLQ